MCFHEGSALGCWNLRAFLQSRRRPSSLYMLTAKACLSAHEGTLWGGARSGARSGAGEGVVGIWDFSMLGEAKKKWCVRQRAARLGKLRTHNTSSGERNLGAEGQCSWNWAVPPRGMSVAGKVGLFLPSSLYSWTFAPVVSWNFTGLSDSRKGTRLWVVVAFAVLWGVIAEKSYSAILVVLTLQEYVCFLTEIKYAA